SGHLRQVLDSTAIAGRRAPVRRVRQSTERRFGRAKQRRQTRPRLSRSAVSRRNALAHQRWSTPLWPYRLRGGLSRRRARRGAPDRGKSPLAGQRLTPRGIQGSRVGKNRTTVKSGASPRFFWRQPASARLRGDRLSPSLGPPYGEPRQRQ